MLTDREVLSTLNMLRNEHLDVRTVTLGISLFDCASHDFDVFAYRVRAKIAKYAGQTRRHLQRSGRQVRHPRRQQAHQRQPHRSGGRVLLPRSDGAGLARCSTNPPRTRASTSSAASARWWKKASRPASAILSMPCRKPSPPRPLCSSINVASTRSGHQYGCRGPARPAHP